MYIYIPKHNMTQVSHSPGRITTMILRFAAKVMHTSDKMNPQAQIIIIIVRTERQKERSRVRVTSTNGVAL